MKLEELGLGVDVATRLRKNGCNSVEDLCELTIEKLEEIIKYPYQVRSIRRVLHDMGMHLKDEYKGINISLEQANIKLDDLVDLDVHLKKVLRQRLYVYTLGELLTTDYNEILKARGIGEHYMEILKQYIHSKGYVIKNEEESLREILIKKRNEGVQLLEELIESPRVYLILYKNGIYTKEDLVNYGPKVLELTGYGPKRRKELLEIMAELGLEFQVDKVINGEKGTEPSRTLVEEVRRENTEIRERIEQKSAVLLEYEELIKERAELLAREKELDELIQSKINELGGFAYVKK